MKILVTGANGYIGSKITAALLDAGHVVIAADISGDHIDGRAVKVLTDIFGGDISFEEWGRPDVCLHLAWKDGFNHNSDAHMEQLSAHYAFLRNLINGGLKHVAVMGTMHEIGYYEGMVGDDTPANPVTKYGTAKNALRKSLEILCNEKGVVFQWLRAFYIYGNDSFGNSVFCKLRQACAEGKKEFPFTTGKNKFDFLHIYDLCEQITAAVTQNKVNGVINICSGEPKSLGEQMEEYIRRNGLPISLKYGVFPERRSESPCIYGDGEKIRKILKERDKSRVKVLVTGAHGQLGSDVCRELSLRGYNVTGADRDAFDITDGAAVRDFFERTRPQAVIHCAAYTAVDKAETEKELCRAVNASGTRLLAEEAEKTGAKFLYISSDYVFDGKKRGEYLPDDCLSPVSAYGMAKAEGEERARAAASRCFIVRISWAFGPNGNNFVKTMLRLAETKKVINVVCDQTGSPTYTPDLAVLLADMIETEKYGVYHATNEGVCSWYEFAREIFRQAGKDVKVNPVTTEEYEKLVPGYAKRPKNSVMGKEKLTENGFSRLPPWQDALKRFFGVFAGNKP